MGCAAERPEFSCGLFFRPVSTVNIDRILCQRILLEVEEGWNEGVGERDQNDFTASVTGRENRVKPLGKLIPFLIGLLITTPHSILCNHRKYRQRRNYLEDNRLWEMK